MIYEPHDYQTYATDFIEAKPISALLLDMGLGKTVITLTALNDLLFDSFDAHKVLIIGPLRVARDTWPAELGKWSHLKGLRSSLAVGDEETRIRALRAKADIYIINRENVEWLVDRSGVPFDFDTVVIDELSSFKNYRSIRFRSLSKVRMRISRIVGLTGTPASNGLMDLWAEFRILDCGKRLGRFITHYREAYFRPDKTNGQVVFSYKPLPGAEDAIYRQISDIAISMRAADHIKMPELVSNTYRVDLSEKERKVYESLKDEMAIDLGEDEITASNAAALSNKLLQLANGAIYTDEKGVREVHQRKLDALEDLIEAANGKPLLVAYWFKHDLSRIEGRLREKGIAYEKLDSPSSISRWNEGKTAVGLIHPASAGHGLNLQSGGSTIVWFGLTWSLELYKQTIARLYRQGQRDKTVVVIHIIASGTIDEYVMKALSKKGKVQDSLIEAVKAEIGGRKQ